MKRGRSSIEDQNVVALAHGRRPLDPPSDLTAAEASLFRSLIASCAPDHFVASDVPLLVSFVQSTLMSRKAAKAMASDPDAIKVWDRATKMQAFLATKLRMAPQSRADPKVLARATARHAVTAEVKRLWE